MAIFPLPLIHEKHLAKKKKKTGKEICTKKWQSDSRGFPQEQHGWVIKLFFMLNSAETKFILLMNVKMPTIVGLMNVYKQDKLQVLVIST